MIDRLAVHAQHTPDAHGVESAVVDQTTNGFRVDPELVRDLTHADEVSAVDPQTTRYVANLQQELLDCLP